MDTRRLLSDQHPCPTAPFYPQPAVPYAGVPPLYNGPQNPQPPGSAPPVHWNISSVSQELAREVFLEYTSGECCYSTKPAREMVITDLCPVNTYRYRLETFTESRNTEWAKEPYNGQFLDGQNGMPPGPWDMAVSAPPLFQKSEKDIRVPNTSTVQGCDLCRRIGKIPCAQCRKTGRIKCNPCGGSGRTRSEEHGQVQCANCKGHGQIKCKNCSGNGTTTCKTCKGKGQLVCYVNLKIKWENHSNLDVIDRSSGLPLELLQSVAGETLFTDMNTMVFPVTSFPDEAVNNASRKAVQEHNARFSNTCRILQQRQTIERVPVTRVHYTWREKTNIFFVYGTDHKVYVKDYPGGCCCVLL